MPFDNTRTLDASDGNYMVIGGIRYPIINSEIEAGRDEDRTLWRIVTEGQEEQPPAAEATAPPLPISECEGGSMCNGHPHQDEEEDEDQEEEEGEPIFKMRTGFDDFLFDKYGPSGTRDSGGIPPRPSGLMVPPLPYSPPREG